MENYIRVFPKYAPLQVFNGRVYGIWIVGNMYKRASTYYGAYPGNMRRRIMSLFPDALEVLHLFSGTIPEGCDDDEKLGRVSYTWDCKPDYNPTICDDVRNLKLHGSFLNKIDLVIADPPYEAADALKYGTSPLNKAQVVRDLGGVMRSGSYLAWLDTRAPMYSKKTWELYGYISCIVSTNTRVRLWSLWRHV